MEPYWSETSAVYFVYRRVPHYGTETFVFLHRGYEINCPQGPSKGAGGRLTGHVPCSGYQYQWIIFGFCVCLTQRVLKGQGPTENSALQLELQLLGGLDSPHPLPTSAAMLHHLYQRYHACLVLLTGQDRCTDHGSGLGPNLVLVATNAAPPV